MAAADWRSGSLIASIRRRGNAPLSPSGWQDADFLAAINEELRSYLVPLIRRVNEEFLIAYTDVSILSGVARYRIPEAALGEGLRDVGRLDSVGDFRPLTRVDPGNRSLVGGFYLEDEDLVLTPTPNTVDTLRLKYVRRPSKVVADNRCYSISNVDTGSGTLTASPLDGTTTLYAFQVAEGAYNAIDVVSARPGFRIELDDVASAISQSDIIALNYNNTTLGTVANALLVSLGDYVCVPGESPVPQVPAEAHPLLAQAVLCQYLRASSQPGLAEAETRRAQMEADLVSLFTPRTQEQPHRTVNRFGPGYPRFRNWRP